MLVIMAHAAPMLRETQHPMASMAASIFSHGGIGVDIFFGLSGFLICTLLLRERAKNGRIDYSGFYIRRAFRILPPMLAYLATVYVLSETDKLPATVSRDEILASVFFYRNYLSGGSWYTGHFWSLAIEEHFYFFTPLLIGLIKSVRRQTRAMAILALVCVVIRGVEFHFPHLTESAKIEFRTECRFDALAYGAIWALLLHRIGTESIRKHVQPVSLTLLVTMAFTMAWWFKYMPLTRTLMGIALATLVFSTVIQPDRLLGKFLELPWLKKIGAMSYSLYIWQMLFFPPWHTPGFPEWLRTFPGALTATFAMGLLSYRLIEIPLTELARNILSAPKIHNNSA